MATCLQLMRTEWFMGLKNMSLGLPIITWQGCLVATGPETTFLLEAKKKKTKVTKSAESVFSQSLYNQCPLYIRQCAQHWGPWEEQIPPCHPTPKLPFWQRRQTKIPAAS